MTSTPDPGKGGKMPEDPAALLKSLGDAFGSYAYLPNQKPNEKELGAARVIAELQAKYREQPTMLKFCALAIEKEFCTPDKLPEVIAKWNDRPSFFETMVKVLSNREGKFFSAHSFYFSTTIFHRQDERDRIEAGLRATAELTDKKVFDLTWEMIGEQRMLPKAEFPALVKRVEHHVREMAKHAPDVFLSRYQFDVREVILAHSAEPARDLALTRAISGGLPAAVTAQQLRSYYEAGHSYICHPQFFGADRFTPADKLASPDEIAVMERFSRMKPYPPLAIQERLALTLCQLTPSLREAVLAAFDSLAEEEVGFEYGESLTNAAVALAADPFAAEIIQAISRYPGQKIVQGVLVLEDIAEMPARALAGYVEAFQRGDLSELETEIYRRKLEEHQRKFPEKPTDEMLRAFRTPENRDSEVPNAAQLGRAHAMYESLLKKGTELVQLSEAALRARSRALSTKLENTGPTEARLEFLAIARESFKRQFGVYPYNTQILAILLMTDTENLRGEHGSTARGIYEQIKTGEGKSMILALTSAYFAFLGRRVDVVTSNSYLARRDATKFERFFHSMGLTCGSYDYEEKGEHPEGQDPRILYTTNQSLVFGYLSSRLNAKPFFRDARFDVALVDEADNLCLDMTRESCRIATPANAEFTRKDLRDFVAFVESYGAGTVLRDLPQAVAELQVRHRALQGRDPVLLALYLRSAVASRQLEENVDYVIRDNKVVIVDRNSTERLKEKSLWEHGLHEFVALKHGLELPPSMGVTAQMSHPAFLLRYRTLNCISGTIGDQLDREELREIYGLTGFDIPTHHPSRRIDVPLSLVSTTAEWLGTIVKRAQQVAAGERPQPILIVAETIADSLALHTAIQVAGLSAQLLNDHTNLGIGGQPRTEHQLIEGAGTAGMITIATGVAGRGADIIPDDVALENGGLHTLLTFIPANKRIEFQARGRAGRQGKQGISEIIASIESDRFLSALPDPLRERIREIHLAFGGGSSEVADAIEFTRRAGNILASIEKCSRLRLEGALAEAQESYFAALQETSQRLNASNPAIRRHSHQGLSTAIVSMYLHEAWTGAFDQLERTLRHGDLLYSGTYEGNLARESLPESVMKLERSFRAILKAAPQALDPEGQTLPDRMYPIFRFYLMNILHVEARITTVDPERIRGIAEGIRTRVSTLVGECFDLFSKASASDIEGFFTEKERKKRDDEKRRNSDSPDPPPATA